MERLTIPDVKIDEKTTKRAFVDGDTVRACAMEFYWRLKKIEDILGDDYDLDNLKKMVEAFDNHRVLLIPKEGIKWLYRFGQDGKHSVYRFTVPSWPECKVTGKRAAKRVINGRLDPAVRNTLGIKWTPVGEEDT